MSENAKPENPAFYTEVQLADRQQRSVKTLQADRLKGGGIPFVKFGRSVRYRVADVIEWEAAHLFLSTSDASRKENTDAR